jgi:uncharacterized hydrophobic protein (TIGR00341 family)
LKLIEIIANAGTAETIAAIAEQNDVQDFRLGLKDENDMLEMRLYVTDDKVQAVLDAAQTVLNVRPDSHIHVIPIEIALPLPPGAARKKEDEAVAAREELYDEVEKSARLDLNFIVLVALSTVVAAIGLVENNVAVVIGAMVIAPLLGPNLALGLATALGDMTLMRSSLATLVTGIGLSLLLAFVMGKFWPFSEMSDELLSRTDVGMDSIALALASGSAAALSLTTRLSSVLVGVMVAVALLPPAATLGLVVGRGEFNLATGAALLLFVNIVCVNLACKLVFLVKGIAPRTWYEREKAKRAGAIYIVIWLVTLALLVLAIYARGIAG